MSSRLCNTWMKTCFFIIVFISFFCCRLGYRKYRLNSIPAFYRFIEVCMMWQERIVSGGLSESSQSKCLPLKKEGNISQTQTLS